MPPRRPPPSQIPSLRATPEASHHSDPSDDEDQGSSTTPATNSGSSNPTVNPVSSGKSPSHAGPSGQTGQPPTSGTTSTQHAHIHTPPTVSELTMIPINLWSDPPLRRASNNWKNWSSQMTLILRTYKAYTYVEGTEICPSIEEQVSFSNWRTNHFMVCAFMLSAIKLNERYEYSQYSKADELWRTLITIYDVTGIMSKMDAMAQLMSMTFTWSTPVTDHYRSIINLANTVFQDGPLFKDDIILHSLLLSLNNDSAKDNMKHARTLLDSKPHAGHNDIYHSLCIAESERKFRDVEQHSEDAVMS